jgi:adenylate cyclase
MGDGFLAVWGAPVQTPSDSLLAVRAALLIQRVVKELNECRAAEGEHPLAVGIGIDTGELVAGYIGSSRTMGYTVVGNTVNRAARLCAVAGPDQVLISEDTFREVQHAVTVQEQPPQTLKGIRKPVRAYEVTSVSLEAPYRPTGT